jgi:hypothetical protein
MAFAVPSDANERGVDYVTKAFHDGESRPHVYDEVDVMRRYGAGAESLSEEGLLRRRYWDPYTRLEVVVTSNPDVAPRYRYVEKIRVSTVATGTQPSYTTESLKGLNLKGVAIGDPASTGVSAARAYGQTHTSQVVLGRLAVEVVCGYDDGSSICFYAHGRCVVAMAVGAGP